jgi:hypothetical protein
LKVEFETKKGMLIVDRTLHKIDFGFSLGLKKIIKKIRERREVKYISKESFKGT